MSPMYEKENTSESEATNTEMEGQEGRAQHLEHDQKIRSRAYEHHLERGQEADHDLDNWLQAEREIDEESV